LASVTSFASHANISLLQPTDLGLNISPGIAKRSFHKSRASFQVIKLPDFFSASIMSVQTDIPATSSFLIGKLNQFPGVHIGNIDITPHQFVTIESYKTLPDTG
jgi:hypothetical protein